jgi:hypothetical protein
MSLRRSPRRTPAFLAANRANAQKSTGPSTEPGKQRSAANAFRTGTRTSPAFWTRGVSRSELAELHALHDALDLALSAGSEGQKLVGMTTRLVWSVRRYAEFRLRTMPPASRRLLANRLVPVPRFWHRNIPRPGWKVTVTVLVRRGRRRQCDLSSITAVGAVRMLEARPARVHVITRVTCTGHPLFNRGPEGVPLSTKPGAKRAEIRTNPEYLTKQANYANIGPNADSLRVPGRAMAAPGAPGGAERYQVTRGTQRTQGTRLRTPETNGVDPSAPPWELPEGYSWVGTERKGNL